MKNSLFVLFDKAGEINYHKFQPIKEDVHG